jgi:hypothetical protein
MRRRWGNCGLSVVLALVCICTVVRAEDTLVYRSGVKIACSVQRLTDDGHVLFKAPFLDAEARGVLAQMSGIALECSAAPGNFTDTVVLTNGDRLVGKLETIGPKKIVFLSTILGRVELPRSVVAMMTSRTRNVLHETDFRHVSATAPWKAYRGSARIIDGALVCKAGTMLSMAVEQNQALTLEVVFVRRKADRTFVVPYVDLILFADSRTNAHGMHSVRLDVDGHQLGFVSVDKGRQSWHVRGHRFQWPTRNGLEPKPLRVAFDPSVPEMTCWVEGRLVRKQKLRGAAPKTGKHITINLSAGGTTAIQTIRLLSGVVPPLGGVPDDAARDGDVIVISDGQRYTTESLLLTPKGYEAQIADGPLTIIARNKVTSVLFARNKREIPRRVKGDVRIQAGGHTLTMQLTGLTPTELTGTSSALGALKLDRANVRFIALNIYAGQPPPEPANPPLQPRFPNVYDQVPRRGIRPMPLLVPLPEL